MDVRNRQHNLGFGTIGIMMTIRNSKKFLQTDKTAFDKIEQIIDTACYNKGFKLNKDGCNDSVKFFHIISHPSPQKEKQLAKKIASVGGKVKLIITDKKNENQLHMLGQDWILGINNIDSYVIKNIFNKKG